MWALIPSVSGRNSGCRRYFRIILDDASLDGQPGYDPRDPYHLFVPADNAPANRLKPGRSASDKNPSRLSLSFSTPSGYFPNYFRTGDGLTFDNTR
jgi:hypothetical protein